MVRRPQLELHLTDITKNKYRPVISVATNLQAENSRAFRVTAQLNRTLIAGVGTTVWSPIAKVPLEALGFPFKGKRKILVELVVRERLDNRVVSLAKCYWSYDNPESGYVEEARIEKAAQIETVKLALWLSAIDGQVDDQEVEVIKSWGARVANSLHPKTAVTRREALNTALQDATEMIREDRSDELESSVLSGLGGETPVRLRYEAYELCAQIARADGVADPEEIALLARIAEGLGLEEEKTKLLSDRHLADADLGAVGGGEPGADSGSDKLLGITEGMEPEEIRKLLNKHFRKWQGRQGSNDAAVREKAQEWLDMIAEARTRHLP